MSKKTVSKREFRDGVSAKPKHKTPSKHPKSGAAFKAAAQDAAPPRRRPSEKQQAARRPSENVSDGIGRKQHARTPVSGESVKTATKTRVGRAKKLAVRNPGQKIMERARDLKERRTDLASFEPVRLQKALAASGAGSRREMEDWIAQGLVTVNGKTAQLGDKVSPDDQVQVKGNTVKLKWPDRLPRIILYYKQEGEIVSRDDPQGRVSIFDRLPQAASSRWVAVGRLDINTSGLLILTTSGELVNRFAHPSFEVEREYAVRVLGALSSEQMRMLTEEGVMLDDGLAKAERIAEQGGEGANKWYTVVIKEGRNREVRRIFEHFGLTVSRLVRTGFGPVGLPNRLKRGQFYELNPAEVAAIVKWADMALPGARRRK